MTRVNQSRQNPRRLSSLQDNAAPDQTHHTVKVRLERQLMEYIRSAGRTEARVAIGASLRWRLNHLRVVQPFRSIPIIATTTYAYDVLGNLASTTDSANNVRHFSYDGLSRRTAAEDLHVIGDGTFGTWYYTYDDQGNATSQTDPNQHHQYSPTDMLRLGLQSEPQRVLHFRL